MAGIDSLVNDRADMFAGNPQGLQQRYAMGQDLLDLLALQKLKKDKEAAQRNIMMQMAAPQGTVKDQLAGQVMDMTKQEVAASLAPGIQQQGQRMAAQQTQNMMGAGLPTLPAPNMARMAGGGIVGYQPGGEVEGEEDPLGYGQIDPQMAGLRSDSVLKNLVEFFARKNAEAERYRRTGSTEQPASYTAEVGPPVDAPRLPVGYKFTPQAPKAGIETVLPAQEYTPQETEANVAAMTETLPPLRAEPAAAPQDKRISRYEDQLARLEAEEKDKLGALIDFLLGAGASGGTNLGATLMGGGVGVQNRQQRIKDEMAQTLKNIETLQLERDQMAQQESQFARGQAAEERLAELERKNRLDIANIQKDEAVARAQAAAGADLNESYLRTLADARKAMEGDQILNQRIIRIQQQYKNNPTEMDVQMQIVYDEFLDDYMAGAGFTTSSANIGSMKAPAPTN